MNPDVGQLFYQMARLRYFEETIAQLWHRGLISGEMHLGIGEEAIVAGVVSHLIEGDALALDHRSTPPLIARGVAPVPLLLELLGREEGLCHGRGGHMHLMSPEHLAVSSGIVGSSAPLACGFALAADHLRPGAVAVAFFGEGAMNQGMLMESLNLATVWRLPAIFVCKDDGFAISTRTNTVTGGSLLERARAFGLPAVAVDGSNVEAVWRAVRKMVERARRGRGPGFILARCHHPEGHFLGDPLLRVFRQPSRQAREIVGPLVGTTLRPAPAPLPTRLLGLAGIARTLLHLARARYVGPRDPLRVARRRLPREVAQSFEEIARTEMREATACALVDYPEGHAWAG